MWRADRELNYPGSSEHSYPVSACRNILTHCAGSASLRLGARVQETENASTFFFLSPREDYLCQVAHRCAESTQTLGFFNESVKHGSWQQPERGLRGTGELLRLTRAPQLRCNDTGGRPQFIPSIFMQMIISRTGSVLIPAPF